MAYDAFISYSHTADGRLAPAVQSGLQRLARPWYRTRALRVFRDETGLSVNPHLWASIESALDESEYFVLLASPESAASPWVAREIEHWVLTKPVDRILPVLTDGELVWDADRGAYDVAQSTALPPLLATAFVAEPRHLDLRWARTEEQLDLRHAGFRAAIAGLAAPMHGVSRDELEGEDVQQHRRTMRLAWGSAALLLFVTIAAVVAATFAVSYASEARANEQRAVAEGARARRNAREATAQRTLAIQNASVAKSAQSQAEASATEADQNAAEADQNAAEATQQRTRAEQNAAESARNAGEARANGDEARRQSVTAQRNAAEASANALRASASAKQAEQNAAAAAQSASEARTAADVAAAQRERALRNADRARAEQHEAEQAATLARSRQLAASALNTLATNPERALLVSVQGRRFQANAQTDDSLMRVLQRQSAPLVGYEPPGPAVGLAAQVIVSPDGGTLAVVGRNHRLALRDLRSRRALDAPSVTVEAPFLPSLSFSRDGARLAVGRSGGGVTVWDVDQGRTVADLPALSGGATALAPDGRTVAAIGPAGITVVDVESGDVVGRIPMAAIPPGLAIDAVALDATGRTVAAHGLDIWSGASLARVLAYEVTSGAVLADVPAENGFDPTLNARNAFSFRFTGEGASATLTSVATNATDATLISWSPTTWARVRTVPTPALATGEVVVAVDGDLNRFGTTSDDGLARVRDAATGAVMGAPLDARLLECTFSCSGSFGQPAALAFGGDGSLVAAGRDGLARRFSTGTPSDRLVARLPIPVPPFATAALAARGGRVATVDPVGTIEVSDATDGTRIRTIVAGVAGLVNQVALSPAGDTVVVAFQVPGPEPFSTRVEVAAWDVATGGLRFRTATEFPVAGEMAVDPSGALVAVPVLPDTPFKPSPVLLLDLVSGAELARVPTARTGPVAFSADGTEVVVGGFDAALAPTVYDIATGHTRTLDDAALAGTTWIAFSADGRVAVAQPLDSGELVVMDAATFEVRRTISLHEFVQGLAVSGDGRRIAVSLRSGGIQLYDTASGEPVGDVIAPPALPGGLRTVFAGDGRDLLVGTPGSFLRVDLDPASWMEQACALAGRNLTRAEWTGLLGTRVPYAATCPRLGAAP